MKKTIDNKIEIINATQHEIAIVEDEITTQTIPVSGIVARCAETVEVLPESINGIELITKKLGRLEGLPTEESYYGVEMEMLPRKMYIVSFLAYQAGKQQGRRDLLCPGELVRDESGRIIGCKNLSI